MVRKGEKQDISSRKKISLSLKKYYSSPLAKKNLSKSLKKYYSNPEVKKRIAKMRAKYWASNPKIQRKYTKLSKKIHSSSVYRKNMSRIKKKQYKENPELIEQIDRTMTEWWREHPNIRKERSEYVKKLFIENPEKFKKFLKYGNNPAIPRFKTRKGFLVKSRGEQQIADFLLENRIKFSYEEETLIFEKEGQICVPDFYLPSFKIYIEFYGGYPGAWKKKVMKNKLYKKYKIPCIFITPAELRDLNYYLIGELKR